MNKLISKTHQAFFYIALITLISKGLGFLREALIASNYGANAETDSYIVAVTIVTSFYLIMGDVINNAFIPQYINLRKENSNKAEKFASSIINIILLASIVLLVVFSLFTKQIVFVFAPGLTSESLLNAVNFTRILIPTLVITGLSLVIRSILQAHNSFIGPAVMGIPNHIAVIAYLLLGSTLGVKGLVYATSVGTSIQLLVQIPFIKGTGFRYRGLRYFEHDDVKRFLYSIGFILLGSSVNQINTLIDRALASLTGFGNISILNYANMLNLFITAVFVLSITTVIFPRLAESTDLEHTQSRVREYSKTMIIVLAPICLLLIFFSNEIVGILFGRRSFTEQNVIDTAKVLTAYSLGIIPFGISEVINRTFYSLGDSKTPMKIGIISVIVNVVLNLILVRYIGVVGLALATSISSAIYMGTSLLIINKKITVLSAEGIRWIAKTFIISIVALAALYLTNNILIEYIGMGLLFTMLRVCIGSMVTMAVYGILMYKLWRL